MYEKIKIFFLTHELCNAEIFLSYTFAYLPYLKNKGVAIGKKPTPAIMNLIRKIFSPSNPLDPNIVLPSERVLSCPTFGKIKEIY